MTREELFDEMNRHLLSDEQPSGYLNAVSECEAFGLYPFTMLGRLKDVPQSPHYHPEGSVWNHTMLVVDSAAQRRSLSKNVRVFMWAALLHDIGKAVTTQLRKGKITSYDHDKAGEKLSAEFLREFSHDERFITEVSLLVRYHMHILYVVNNLPFGNIRNMKRQVPIEEVALLGLCDRLGRADMDEQKMEEELKNIEKFLKKCTSN